MGSFCLFFSLILALAMPSFALAQDLTMPVLGRQATPNALALIPGTKIAQAADATSDADDTYDPFADYSEFDQDDNEEADINFFRNGRFVTLGFLVGLRGWTENLGKVYHPATHFGVFLSYFFDLRFALQFTYLTGDHSFSLTNPIDGATYGGNIGIQSFQIDFKYYLNTQNVTKGLAAFNPYLIGGFSNVYRTTNVDNVTAYGKESAMGFDLGAGVELPMMRKKMFFGAQAMYQLVNFKDEHSEVLFDNSGSTHTNIYLNGDTYTVLAILGVNF